MSKTESEKGPWGTLGRWKDSTERGDTQTHSRRAQAGGTRQVWEKVNGSKRNGGQRHREGGGGGKSRCKEQAGENDAARGTRTSLTSTLCAASESTDQQTNKKKTDQLRQRVWATSSTFKTRKGGTQKKTKKGCWGAREREENSMYIEERADTRTLRPHISTQGLDRWEGGGGGRRVLISPHVIRGDRGDLRAGASVLNDAVAETGGNGGRGGRGHTRA